MQFEHKTPTGSQSVSDAQCLSVTDIGGTISHAETGPIDAELIGAPYLVNAASAMKPNPPKYFSPRRSKIQPKSGHEEIVRRAHSASSVAKQFDRIPRFVLPAKLLKDDAR